MSKGFVPENPIPGIEMVADNLYRVNVSLIEIERASDDPEDDSLRYINPREIALADGIEIEAFNPANMDSLKESIQNQGLLNPLIARYKEDKVFIIEGHRRFRAISELIKEKAPCTEIRSGKTIPANQLYNSVLVRLFDESTSDKECFEISFKEDKSKVKFGAGAEIRFVYYCMMRDVSDDRIMQMLDATPEWLKETKNLLRAFEEDEQILKAIFTDKINRSAAKALAQIEDYVERKEIFKQAMAEAQEDCDVKLAKYRRSLENIDNRIEIAKGRKIISEHLHKHEDAVTYDDEIDRLTENRADVVAKIESTTPTVNPDALRRGSEKAPASGKARPKAGSHRVAPAERISTKWRKFFDNLQEKQRIGDVPVDANLIAFAMELLESCTDKDNDPEEFVMKWNPIFQI